MRDTGSPPECEQATSTASLSSAAAATAESVSPLASSSSHHASRSSTPGISSLDGTPRYLYATPASIPPTLPSPSRSPPPDMAIKPVFLFEHESSVRNGSVNLTGTPDAGKDNLPPSMPQDHSSDPSPTRTAVPDEELKPVVPLSELTRLLRLQRYQKRRCYQAEENLHYLHIAAARTSRLARAARSVQHTLAECIKAEDKASFANLLHAFRDACDDCLTPATEAETGKTAEGRLTTSILDNISSSSRATILEFLSKIRNDGNFLANRLKSLTHKELIALLPDRSIPRSNDSIFGGSTRSNSRVSKPLGFIVDAQVDLLSSYAHSSALEMLIFSTNGLSKAGYHELDRTTNIWATVSAILISEQKPGSERLVPAVLDIWTHLLPWPGKERLQIWILRTLQEGSFLLEQPSKQSFRARVEGRSDVSVEDELRTESFYAQAADSLLDLFGDQSGSSVIPPGALKMCHAIWTQLSDSSGHQRALPQFLITRWLFSTFVLDAVTLPEAHGMLTETHVSDITRQRILREIVNRAQKSVFDVAYAWKYGSVIPAETTARVHTVMCRFSSFAFDCFATSTSLDNQPQSSRRETFLAVSVKDVSTCLNALYPQRRPASVSSDGDNLKSGLQSSASSISGFSLFQNTQVPDLSTSVSTLNPPGFQGLHITDATQPELGKDTHEFHYGLMREVCIELEDFVSGYGATSKDLWDVLYASNKSEALCTATEKYADVCSPESLRRGTSSTPGALIIRTSRKEKSPVLKAVESLLYDAGTSVSLDDSFIAHEESQDLVQAQQQLESLFDQAIQDCEARLDYVKAHDWFVQLQAFRSQINQSTNRAALRNMLVDIETGAHRSADRALLLHGAYEKWYRLLHTRQQLQTSQLNPIMEEHERLRDKMWYVADVRTSAVYEEARSIASALRVMGKPKRLSRTRMAPPLRNWSTSKMTNTNLHLKTEAQILEILSARPDHGGPNKLSDDQSRAVELWMDRQNVDNLCKGEERLHKLCMEIRKCVDTITATPPAENTAIWSNVLFARDAAFKSVSSQSKPSLLSGLHGCATQSHFMSLHGHPRSNDALSNTSHTLSSISSRDYLDSRSPTLANRSSNAFWSPATTEVDSPSSATSVNSSMTPSAFEASLPKQQPETSAVARSALERLRRRTTSLVLSDLTSVLFSDGSETDRAYWTGLGWELADRHFRNLDAVQASMGSQTPTAESSMSVQPSIPSFGFESAFATLLQKFSLTSNPSTKLSCLHDIDKLLVPYMAEHRQSQSALNSHVRPTSAYSELARAKTQDTSETSVSGFRRIFSNSSFRPNTIFRDLQYIAALVPANVLQNTPEGKAFCNAAVAITSLKHEARNIMVETADSIIAYHSNNRGHGRSSSTAQQERDSATFSAPTRTPSAEDYSRYSMADAAYLLQITAKEGDSVAQRELATLYLTHPELMDRVVTPFARSKDVFKDELEVKWRKNQDPNRFDYYNFCVVLHWMNLSSKGGDSLAKEYLKQREEMDSF